jgi:hypothetical protein
MFVCVQPRIIAQPLRCAVIAAVDSVQFAAPPSLHRIATAGCCFLHPLDVCAHVTL